MTLVEIIDEQNLVSQKHKDMLLDLIKFAAKYEKIDLLKTEMSISFVDIKEIHTINKQYRNIDRPTDVISFALNDEVEGDLDIIGGDEINYIGDVIICVDIAKEQAIEYKHSFERELGFLLIHGFLHLLGYDHVTEEDEKEMFSRQDIILNNYGLTR